LCASILDEPGLRLSFVVKDGGDTGNRRQESRALSKPVGNGSPVTLLPVRECGQECRRKRDEQKCFWIMSIFCVSSQCTDCFYVSE